MKINTGKFVFGLIILYGALYVLMSPLVAMPFYNQMLFFPDRTNYESEIQEELQTIKKMGVSLQDVHFLAGHNRHLHAWLFRVPSAKKVILLSHGNAGNIDGRLILADVMLRLGHSVFMYDYSGFGKSEGEPTVPAVREDVIGAYDYLVQSEHYSPDDIIGYGESIGTGVTCELSRRRKLGAIILQSGFPSLIHAAHERIWYTRLYPDSWFPSLDCVAAVSVPHPPLLLIHGSDDANLPAEYSEIIYNAAAPYKQKVIIEHMGHAVYPVDVPIFSSALTTFLQEAFEPQPDFTSRAVPAK